jgi:hypothetical protein
MPETSRIPGENSERDQSDRGRLHAVADQTAEVARQVGDKGADVAKRAVQTAADAGRRTAEAATHVGDKIAAAVKGTTETAADATHRTAEVARNTAAQAGDQGREATLSGFRALAGVQGPLADAGFEQSRRALEVTSGITDVYRQAAERASGDVRALFDSWTSLGRGVQRWQQAYVDAVRQSMESMARKRQDLVQANSPVQFAEVQRDLYVDLMKHTLKASTTLLQLTGQIAQDAVRPLQERAQARA